MLGYTTDAFSSCFFSVGHSVLEVGNSENTCLLFPVSDSVFGYATDQLGDLKQVPSPLSSLGRIVCPLPRGIV